MSPETRENVQAFRAIMADMRETLDELPEVVREGQMVVALREIFKTADTLFCAVLEEETRS